MREAVIVTESGYAAEHMYCPIRHCECKGTSCMMWHPMIDEENQTMMDIGMCGFCNYQLKDIVIRRHPLDDGNETE